MALGKSFFAECLFSALGKGFFFAECLFPALGKGCFFAECLFPTLSKLLIFSLLNLKLFLISTYNMWYSMLKFAVFLSLFAIFN